MAADNKREVFASLMLYGTLGIEMGLSLVIGLAMGYCLDRYAFGTTPLFTIIFMIFGLLAGMKRLYTLWKKMEEEDARDDSERH
jgi:ATP synthase protein I